MESASFNVGDEAIYTERPGCKLRVRINEKIVLGNSVKLALEVLEIFDSLTPNFPKVGGTVNVEETALGAGMVWTLESVLQ